MGIAVDDPLDTTPGEAEPDPSDTPAPTMGHAYLRSGLKSMELTVNRYPPVGSSKAAAG